MKFEILNRFVFNICYMSVKKKPSYCFVVVWWYKKVYQTSLYQLQKVYQTSLCQVQTEVIFYCILF